MDRVEAKLHSAVSSSKKILHRHRQSADIDDVPGLTDNAAFNTAAMPDSAQDQRRTSEKIAGGLKTAREWVKHPGLNAKSTATGKVMPNERPWLREQGEADEAMMDLQDKIEDGENRLNGHINDPDEKLTEDMQRMKARLPEQRQEEEDLIAERRQLQATWHMSRYVRRARVVKQRPLAFPSRNYYKQYDANGRYVRTDWITWLGHLLLYSCQDFTLHVVNPTNETAYDKEVLIVTVERLLVASAAFQLWWMRVRKVYMWTDPWLTGKWLALYLVLLKTGYVMTFFWSYLLYSVISNRSGRHSRQWMRDSYQRAHATQERAEMISEFVLRHGKDQWLDPLLEEFGPFLQLQLGDTAHFLEMCASYYDWINVRSTTATCCLYAALTLLAAIPRVDYSMKVFWLAAGSYFFVSRPIATNYPRFRHAVDPLRWTYWNAPTTSEWAFGYLHGQAQRAIMDRQNKRRDDERLSDHVHDHRKDGETDEYFDAEPLPQEQNGSDNLSSSASQTLLNFSARSEDQSGSLELTEDSVRFIALKAMSKHRRTLWACPFNELLEVRKIKRIDKTAKITPPYGLGFLWSTEADFQTSPDMAEKDMTDGLTELFGLTSQTRDEAFNSIIGLSGARWVELPLAPEDQHGIHRRTPRGK